MDRRPPLAPACRTLPEYLRHWAQVAPDRRAFTFVDHPAPHSRGVHRTLTWRRLDLRVRALAARLSEETTPGSRVALLCPQGIEYVTGFLAALTAGMVAVPLYPPGLPGHADRLAGVLTDASPTVVVTTGRELDSVREFCAGRSVRLVCADEVPDAAAELWRPVAVDPGAVAYLQYTSGSTRAPAGVEITHGNVVANAWQALSAYGADTHPVTCVGWLPLYHDMGLVLSVAAPVARGLLSVLMDPTAFLHQPGIRDRPWTGTPWPPGRRCPRGPTTPGPCCWPAAARRRASTCGSPTPSRVSSCPKGRSVRSACRGPTWAADTGTGRRRPGTSSVIRRTARAAGCAPVTSGPCWRDSWWSPAG